MSGGDGAVAGANGSGPPTATAATRSKWVPRVGLGIAAALLIYALVSLSVGEGGPKAIQLHDLEPVQQLFGGIPQDGPYVGPEDADVTITVFTDLRCPSCGTYQVQTIDPLIEKYARPGDARFELRHFSLGPEETTLAADAATAAGEQGHEWQYADILFRNLDQAGPVVDQDFLDEVAGAVPEFDTDQWRQDLDAAAVTTRVESDAQTATDLRLPASGPSVVVSGPAGERTLEDSPSQAEIEAAITAVG